MAWPSVETITTARCRLEPLRVGHADAMVDVLAAPALYQFTGGTGPTRAQLRRRYRAQAVGHSGDLRQWWFNWIVFLVEAAPPLGYIQATVERRDGLLQADLAWVIRPSHQGRGLATEAAAGVRDWLAGVGVVRYIARIHPGNGASVAVARKLGLRPGEVVEDGEVVWASTP